MENTTMQKVANWAMWAGIALILVSGLIHLYDAPSSWGDAPYKGALFVADGAAAVVAAFGIYRGERSWGWGRGLLVAVGSILSYIYSRTIGLPGLQPDDWLEPIGVLSLVVEGLFTGLAIYVLSAQTARGPAARA